MYGEKAKPKPGEMGGKGGPTPPGGFKRFAAVPDWVGAGGKARARGPPPNIDLRSGDWPCPNVECPNWNWAKRNECSKCNAEHPCRKKVRTLNLDARS